MWGQFLLLAEGREWAVDLIQNDDQTLAVWALAPVLW